MKKFGRVLAGASLALLLAACSSETSSEPNKVEKKEAEKPKVEEKYNKVVPVEELEDRDYGGLTFKWAGPMRTIDPNASEVKEKWLERIQALEKKWNFKFESVEIPYDSMVGDYIRTTLAGDPVGDIVYVHAFNYYPAFPENGIAYPVSDLNVVDFDDPKWVQSARKTSEYKGKTYSVRPGTMETVIVRDGIWWNKTQFKNLGLPNLYEVYESGEWTWDKMFEIAEAATKDLDNDGKVDVYGLGADRLAFDLIYNNGAEAINKTKDGVDVNLNDPKIVEALEYFQKVHKDHKRVFLQPKEEGGQASVRNDFRDGRVLMVAQDWWVSTSDLNGGRMKDEYGFIPFPAGPSNENPEQPVSVGHDDSMEIMLGTVEKPKEKLEIWDEITNIGTAEDWERWTREEYETGANDAESVEYAMLMHQNVKTNLIYGFGELNGIVNKLFTDIASGATTVQTGLEAVDPQIQAALKDFRDNGVDLGVTEEEIEQTKEELKKAKEGQ
ncbi:ABC transporter substrate-binding protein [Neobacillus vireti]|uniref:ABC transporter substrate-binding protein n=1 Tax=Neobacillus vireti TaxID=220686 RepID=UPI003000488C